MNRIKLKEDAKKLLKGKYKDSTILLLIYFGINFIVGLVVGFFSGMLNAEESVFFNLISQIISLVVTSLFLFGYVSYFLKISRGEEVTYKELFSKTNMLVPCMILTVLVGLFTTLWSLLLIIPGIIAAISYSLSSLIMVDNPEMSAMEAIKKSKEITYGHKMDLFVLELSFLGWLILGVFTFGILYFWLIPYMQVTLSKFYDEIKGN